MTKEQEEAIDYVQKQIDYFKKQIKFIEAVDRTYYAAEYELYKNRVKQFETVLSMLKENSAEIEQKNTELAEKNTEIERLEKVLDEKYIFVTEARTVYARLMSLDKEDIVKNDLALRNEIYQHIEDNDKKDKIIDLMAEYIFQNVDVEEDICNSAYVECTQETAQDITCINCIKQYFERKSEE